MPGGGEGVNRMEWSFTCQEYLVKVKVIYSELCKDVWAKTEDSGSNNEGLDRGWDVVSGKQLLVTQIRPDYNSRGSVCWRHCTSLLRRWNWRLLLGSLKRWLIVHSSGLFHKCSWGLHAAFRLWITPGMGSNKCLGWEDATCAVNASITVDRGTGFIQKEHRSCSQTPLLEPGTTQHQLWDSRQINEHWI